MLSIVLLVGTATITVYIGSKISAGNNLLALDPQELDSVEMTLAQALIIPVSSSVCLLLLFFFFAYLQYLLMALLVLVGAASLLQLTYLSIQYFISRMNERTAFAFALVATVVATIDWALTGNVVVHNLLGCALCITFISTLRFPSMKIAVICLSLLVVYDIFWVFCSEFFFHKNVMVEVATQVASNPIYEVGQHMHVSMLKYVKPTVELPLKLMFPNAATGRMVMLGLGDIALPGALVAFALRCDNAIVKEKVAEDENDEETGLIREHNGKSNSCTQSNSNTNSSSGGASGSVSSLTTASPSGKTSIATPLFNHAMCGYFFGLIAAFVGNTWSGHPQPALIYLVPGVLLPVLGKAWHTGKLNDVWAGPLKIQQST